MATFNDDAIFAAMASADFPSWNSPADLARASVQGLWRGGAGERDQRSSGAVRLTGGGVVGSTARIDSVGEVMIVLQRLISSTGASIRGFKTLRGRLGLDIKALTQLNLRAAPAQGSILLFVEPVTLPSTELTDNGQPMLIDQPQHQLVDQSIGRIFELLLAAKELGPDADTSEFLARVVDLGPRVASALRDFAKDVRDDDFNFEFRWEEPGQATKNVSITTAEAKRITEVVVSYELDRDTVEIAGILRTVSDVGPLVIELEDGVLETVRTTGLEHDVIVGLNVGDFAIFDAEMRVQAQPGGGQRVSYNAIYYRGNGQDGEPDMSPSETARLHSGDEEPTDV